MLIDRENYLISNKPRRGDMLIDRENYLISNKPRRGDMLIDVYNKKIFQNCCVYICNVYGSRLIGIKREVRLHSDAIPVAVNPL